MTEANIAVELPGMRVSYDAGSLLENDLEQTWHQQLERWMQEARNAGLAEPNAMVLATADAEGVPSSRTVLCKGISERGVVLYTNYTSVKSHELEATRLASVTFPWFGMQRQAHVRGTVQKADVDQTREYWRSRPRGSQLGAWASPQSSVVNGRESLESALENVQRRFVDTEEIPLPPHWGGWLIKPEVVEFWQGREDRLHDRLRFRKNSGGWIVQRIAP